ncbi:transposase [Microcoleus sp. Pol7_A1]
MEGDRAIATCTKNLPREWPHSVATIQKWVTQIVGYFEERATNGIVERTNYQLQRRYFIAFNLLVGSCFAVQNCAILGELF